VHKALSVWWWAGWVPGNFSMHDAGPINGWSARLCRGSSKQHLGHERAPKQVISRSRARQDLAILGPQWRATVVASRLWCLFIDSVLQGVVMENHRFHQGPRVAEGKASTIWRDIHAHL
jgi:hypothetical protein